MIALLIVAALALYCGLGFLVARWQRPATWDRVRKEEDPIYRMAGPEIRDYVHSDPEAEAKVQSKVRHRLIVIVFTWPWVLPVSLGTSAMNKFADRGDPVRMAKRRRAERGRRTREQEQEAGIEPDRR
jgi:hypothetical protein